MRFPVPQYIDIEDKIGPLTFKQYLYIGGSLGLSFILFYFIPYKIVSFLLIIPVATLGGLLAFYKHNNRPFIFLLESFLYYLITTKLYIWRKLPADNTKSSTKTPSPSETPSTLNVPTVGKGKIHRLAVGLDMKEHEDNKLSDRL